MYRPVLYTFALALATLILLAACGEKKTEETGATADSIPLAGTDAPRSLPAPADSLVVDNSLQMAGREIAVETNLWYNLMPGPDDNEPPQLNIQVRLMTEEKSSVPGGLTSDYVWVTIGGGTWGVDSDEAPMGSGAVVERMFRGGPFYDEEIDSPPTATVTVRLTDKDGREYFIRKTGQAIDKVY